MNSNKNLSEIGSRQIAVKLAIAAAGVITLSASDYVSGTSFEDRARAHRDAVTLEVQELSQFRDLPWVNFADAPWYNGWVDWYDWSDWTNW